MKRSQINLIIAGLISLVLLVPFLPRESKFGYTYELGRPWQYAPLIAQYDFPIYKSDAQLKADQDSAMKGFQPFVVLNENVAGEQLKRFNGQDTSKDMPAPYKSFIYNKLRHIYEQGVIDLDLMTKLNEEDFDGVRVVDGTNAVSLSKSELYTPRSAYEYIMSADSTHFSHDVLVRFHFNDYLQPNLVYDSLRTNQALKDIIASVSVTTGMVQVGQKIIDRGEIINDTGYSILSSFEREMERRTDTSGKYNYLLAGQILYVLLVLVVFIMYLLLYRKDLPLKMRNIVLLFSLLTLFPLLTELMVKYNVGNVYFLPYAIAAIFVRVFMDSRTAIATHLCIVLLSALALRDPYQFILVELAAGFAAVYSLRELTQRSQLLQTAFIVTLAAEIACLAYNFTQGITYHDLARTNFIYLVINGVILLFAYPLLYVIERLLGFSSSVTLVELSNINTKLLRQMARTAQGTFVHSMSVANLAAEVANKIGAETQLVRTGALYHDIGKTLNPAFFTENQSSKNPHDELSAEESAKIIINHVTDGMKLAEKYNLPKAVRDFILTHHGHGVVGYFYKKACESRGEENVNVADFTYPGHNPQTREQAILMMADTVEAASRSLKEYTEESISELVNRLIDDQMKRGCFTQSNLSFRDIHVAKYVLTESLKTLYHTRIAYPGDPQPVEEVQEEERAPRFGFTFRGWNENSEKENDTQI